jgi:hypothetical protein
MLEATATQDEAWGLYVRAVSGKAEARINRR